MSLLDHLEGDSRAKLWIKAHLDYPHADWCLIWPFGTKQGGYAAFGETAVPVHRVMCEHKNGPPPSEEANQAAHSCGRGHDACVNPNHLSWKTNAQNQIERYQHSGPTKRTKLCPEDVDEILALKGRSRIADIAKQFGVIELTIHRIHAGKLWRNTSTLQQRMFTAEEIFSIRSRHYIDSSKKIASEYGVNRAVIERIQCRKTYKWVDQFCASAEPTSEVSRAERGGEK